MGQMHTSLFTALWVHIVPLLSNISSLKILTLWDPNPRREDSRSSFLLMEKGITRICCADWWDKTGLLTPTDQHHQ